MITIVFSSARDGGVMTKIDGRAAFPDRRWTKTHPLPNPGEEWEVTVAGENPKGTVYFLLPVRLISTEAGRQEAAKLRKAAEYFLDESGYRAIVPAHAVNGMMTEKDLRVHCERVFADLRASYDAEFGVGAFDEDAKIFRLHRTQKLPGLDLAEIWQIHKDSVFAVQLAKKYSLRRPTWLNGVSLADRTLSISGGDADKACARLEEFLKGEEEYLRQERDAIERMKKFLSRVPRREMETRVVYTQTYITKAHSDSDWGLHEADPGYMVEVVPTTTIQLWANDIIRVDYDKVVAIVGMRYDPHDAEEGAEDEYERDEVGISRLIYAVGDAIAPYRWVWVEVKLDPQVENELRADFEALAEKTPEFEGWHIKPISGLARIDPRTREFIK